MFWMMQRAGKQNINNNDFQFWQQDNQPIELYSEDFIKQKLDYLNNNPVTAGFVKSPELWQYSSCGDYYGTDKGPIELIYLE